MAERAIETVQHAARVERVGSSDYGHVRGACSCGWGARTWHSRKTAEGTTLAQRDADDHVRYSSRASS